MTRIEADILLKQKDAIIAEQHGEINKLMTETIELRATRKIMTAELINSANEIIRLGSIIEENRNMLALRMPARN